MSENVFYNEHDPHAAAWLRNLAKEGHIPDGTIDEADIRLLAPDAVRPHRTGHFFAGIGGWPLALDMAGWPRDRPVWTGSCPCQPFSSAGKRKGKDDARHLWPDFFRLIRECRPQCVFGEQVAGADGLGWLDGVSADLEGEGYAVGSAVLGAHSVGAPHRRQRIYWVAHTRLQQPSSGPVRQDTDSGTNRIRSDWPGGHVTSSCGGVGVVAHLPVVGRRQGDQDERWGNAGVRAEGDRGRFADDGQFGGMGHAHLARLQRHGSLPTIEGRDVAGPVQTYWSDHDLIPCRDGKTRRAESGVRPLADGVPGRVGRLRGYGNAIVPQVAATFVRAFLESQVIA